MHVAVGCDPNAQQMKLVVIDELELLGHTVEDFGSDDPIYANVAFNVAEAVVSGRFDRGVVLCGTGIGVSLAANKVRGAYCALVTDAYQAERAVLSNNANMIAFGAQVTGEKTIRMLVRLYMEKTYESSSRSEPKIRRIMQFEETR